VKRFEHFFKFDENRVPRDWTPEDDIAKHFTVAKKKGLELIELFRTSQLQIAGVDEFPLLADGSLASLEEQYEQATQPLFREALDRQRANSVNTALPYWTYIVLIVLGFNEFMLVLSSPMYYVPLILMCAMAYAAHTMGMLKPALKIFNSVMRQIFAQANAAINPQQQPQPARPQRAAPSSQRSRKDQ